MTPRYPAILAICACLAAGAGPAHAQDEPPDRWSFNVELGFNAATGNSELAVLTTSVGVKRLETDAFEFDWTAAYRYGESENDVVARNIKSSISFDLWPHATWSPFVFADAERDPFLRLDVRTNAGSGVKYTFVDTDATAVSLSAAVVHSYENFRAPAGDTPLDSRSNARWSVRVKAAHEFDNGLEIENISWYKPVYDAPDDYNIDTTTKIGVALSSVVGLNFSHSYRRDSTPPPDVERDDHIIQAGVRIEF